MCVTRIGCGPTTRMNAQKYLPKSSGLSYSNAASGVFPKYLQEMSENAHCADTQDSMGKRGEKKRLCGIGSSTPTSHVVVLTPTCTPYLKMNMNKVLCN